VIPIAGVSYIFLSTRTSLQSIRVGMITGILRQITFALVPVTMANELWLHSLDAKGYVVVTSDSVRFENCALLCYFASSRLGP